MPRRDIDKKREYEREYIAKPEVAARRREKYKKWAVANKDKLSKRGAKRRLEKRAMTMVATVRTRARMRGMSFDLDLHIEAIQARIDAGVCEVTGQPFDLSPGRRFNSPSIDRIACERGYTYDNIRVVLNLVNVAMGDWGEQVLRNIMVAWLTRADSLTGPSI